MSQIIYPKYAGFIMIYAIIFLFLGVTIARGLDILFPKFEENKDKAREKPIQIYLLEISAQIAIIVLATYMFREIVHYMFTIFPVLKKNMYGQPDRFAALIIAPTTFAVQPNLILKIRYVWGL